MNDYPRMLYRPGTGDSEVWGEAVDTKTISSPEDEAKELRNGWMRDPNLACAKAKQKRIWRARFDWAASHWKFWISTAIGVAALWLAYVALK